MPGTLLVIDDEPDISHVVRPVLQKSQVKVESAETGEEGLTKIASRTPDAILLDIGLPDKSGLDVFRQIQEHDSRIPVIIMTGQGTTETAIEAMKMGAYDYILKPFRFPRIRDLILQAIDIGQAMRVPVLSAPPTSSDSGRVGQGEMVGRSEAMQEVYKMIGRVAPQEGIVLIRGESGTGKELVARAIYQHSQRADSLFLAINCAAIPEALLESELFGHEKGAFTGADRQRIGKFEQCSRGTLFLDEVGDMPPLTQAKVLRVLQDQQFERVGGTTSIRTNVRVIAATNRDLEAMVKTGQFRSDLYYRLNVFTIMLPPLRERLEDMPLLIQHFIDRFSPEMQRDVRKASPETIELLKRYPWPGNLRELQSVIRQALLQAIGTVLLPEFIPESIRQIAEKPKLGQKAPSASQEASAIDWDAFIDERLEAGSQSLYNEWFSKAERYLLMRVLRYTQGNQLRSAAILGITRRSLRNKIRTLGITIERSVGSGIKADTQDSEEADAGEDTPNSPQE